MKDRLFRFALVIPLFDILVATLIMYCSHYPPSQPTTAEDKCWLLLVYCPAIIFSRTIGRLLTMKRKGEQSSARHVLTLLILSIKGAISAMLFANIIIWTFAILTISSLTEFTRILLFGFFFPVIKITCVNISVMLAASHIGTNTNTINNSIRGAQQVTSDLQRVLPMLIAGGNVLLNTASIVGIMMSCGNYSSFFLQFLCHALMGKLSWILLLPKASAFIKTVRKKSLRKITKRYVIPVVDNSKQDNIDGMNNPDDAVVDHNNKMHLDQIGLEVLGREAGETAAVIVGAIASLPLIRDNFIYADPKRQIIAELSYDMLQWSTAIATAFAIDKVFAVIGIWLMTSSGVEVDISKLPHSRRDMVVTWIVLGAVYILMAVGRY